MIEARGWSAAASHSDYGWVITGGGGPKSGDEKTDDGQAFEPFLPSTPLELQAHCLVSLDGGDNGDFLLTGGIDDADNYNKESYIFRGGEWRRVEDMPTAREGKKPN